MPLPAAILPLLQSLGGGGGGGAMASIPGKVTEFAQSIANATKTVIGLPKALNDWTQSLADSRKSLAEFSPQLANAYRKLEVRQRVGSMQEAGALGGRTEALLAKIADAQDELRPARVAIEEVKLVVQGFAVGILKDGAEILKKFPWLGAYLQKIQDSLDKQKPTTTHAQTFVRDVLAGKLGGRKNPPPV